MDAIQIGGDAASKSNSTTDILSAIAIATNGYTFAPLTLRQALQIMELETVLSSKERPNIPARPLIHNAADLRRYASRYLYPLNVCDGVLVPERRSEHALLLQTGGCTLDTALHVAEKVAVTAEACEATSSAEVSVSSSSRSDTKSPVSDESKNKKIMTAEGVRRIMHGLLFFFCFCSAFFVFLFMSCVSVLI